MTPRIDPDAEDALGSAEEQAHRRRIVDGSAQSSLAKFARALREKSDGHRVPDFDPLDGDLSARVLIVLESPGPEADGTGFVSRNNPDPTARRLCRFLRAAELPRTDTLLWNAIPWYLGKKSKLTPEGRRAGRVHLSDLVTKLEGLQVIVLMGEVAHGAQDCVAKARDCIVIKTQHPGDRAMNGRPHRERMLFRQLCAVSALLESRSASWVLSHPVPQKPDKSDC